MFWLWNPYQIYNLYIFSPIPWVAFLRYGLCPFMYRSVFFYIAQLIYFSFCHYIQVKLRNYCQIQFIKLPPVFSSRSFIVLALIYRSLIHSEFIFVNGIINVQLHSFPCQYPVFPSTICWNDYPFPLNGFATLVENHPTTYASLFFGSLCYYIGLCVCLYASTTLFWLL